ncbi:serine hydrolase domain-containing protein [Altericroceibacterium endophyticum]|uniref:Serine hydrolase n=1 Tax=Altericroceibacterium endophyticum TaxID=1808508 RepID=A0A6I4T477_9SPHN|nr:serine hydrolase [Altericroceibacterium endophyticum]MXO65707.1 serine hydrolase [Altericroceibacterium endophyticum]
MKRPLTPTLLSLLLPAFLLASCGDAAPDGPPPVAPEVMATIAEKPGTDRETLARRVDALFTREDLGETRAVILMHAGEVAAERYAEPYDADTRFLGWSMAKTVTGVLTGILIAEGRLQLDEDAPIPRWRRAGDPRGDITIRQLLQMRSGLRHAETAPDITQADTVRMLFLDGRDHMAQAAEAQPLEFEPGTQFTYSTANSIVLMDIAARVLAPGGSPDQRREQVAAFLQSRLIAPLGMDSMRAEYDASGTMIGGSMIWANARDWAKFGELLRHGGSERGIQLVPRGWVNFMTSPSPAAPDYGASLWLNRESDTHRTVLFPDRLPESIFAAVGHQGQYVIVWPEKKLTLVRLGQTEESERPALQQALADVLDVYSGK